MAEENNSNTAIVAILVIVVIAIAFFYYYGPFGKTEKVAPATKTETIENRSVNPNPTTPTTQQK